MASSQSELRKIGLEGFALIDKFYGPARRSPASDAFPGRREGFWVVHQANGEMEEPVVKTKEVCSYGAAVANYPRAKPQNRWVRPIKPF
uniref:Uncharacterized protein n=1 Tax=Cajanus cajan TaxID=3821 RepID=A0A151RLR5_CAJCA|nr:hypothetical protein KK1_035066 [Cajanus cajan]KYP43501.1 hypothetical protein KK1_035068 [Cajanus cajan]